MITEGEAAILLELTQCAFRNQEKSKQRSAIKKVLNIPQYSRNSGPENPHHKVWQDNKVSSCLVIKNFIKLFKKDFLHDWNGDIQLLFINWQQKKSVERVGQYKISFRNETIYINWLHLKKKSKRYPLTTIERTFIFHFNSSNPK